MRTTIDGIIWPSILTGMGAQLASILYQLEVSQWYTNERLLNHQKKHFFSFLKHVEEQVPYYQEALKVFFKNLNEENIFDKWSEIPFLTRYDIQNHSSQLFAQNYPKSHGGHIKMTTSGSTGKPIEVWKTNLNQVIFSAVTLRSNIWAKRDFKKAFAAIRYNEKPQAKQKNGIKTNSWGDTVGQVFNTGPGLLLDIRQDIDDQLDWVIKNKPEYLLTYPSNLKELILRSIEKGLDMPFLKQVQTMSEVTSPDLRSLCQKHWNVKINDVYSAHEIGYIALQCPEYEHYHLQSDSMFIEVLTDDNKPAKPGEVGRVVVTSLFNYYMPLIRYEIEDYVEVGEACPCGRGLPVIKDIKGRVRNLVQYPDGRSNWPIIADHNFHKIGSIKQYQAIQTTLEDINFNVVVGEPLSLRQEKTLEKDLRKWLGYDFNIHFNYVDDIPRSAGGKFEDFKSEL